MAKRRTIILADDDPDFLRLFAGSLETYENLRVLRAPDGMQALNYAQSRPVDLVITDLVMPYVDGFGLVWHLKDLHVPIIAISGHIDHGIEESLQTAGVRELLKKPFEPAKLAEAVLRHLPVKS